MGLLAYDYFRVPILPGKGYAFVLARIALVTGQERGWKPFEMSVWLDLELLSPFFSGNASHIEEIGERVSFLLSKSYASGFTQVRSPRNWQRR